MNVYIYIIYMNEHIFLQTIIYIYINIDQSIHPSILSYLILSYFILYYPIYLILSYLILSNLILSYCF